MERYNIKNVEKKWQDYWSKEKTHTSKINKIKSATTVRIILLLLARIFKLSNFNLFKFRSNRLLIDLLMFFKFLTNEFGLVILIKSSYKVLF